MPKARVRNWVCVSHESGRNPRAGAMVCCTHHQEAGSRVRLEPSTQIGLQVSQPVLFYPYPCLLLSDENHGKLVIGGQTMKLSDWGTNHESWEWRRLAAPSKQKLTIMTVKLWCLLIHKQQKLTRITPACFFWKIGEEAWFLRNSLFILYCFSLQ